MADAEQSTLTTLTVNLLSAYVANNNVEHDAIPELIKSTHAALKIIDTDEPPAPEEPEYKPAVSVRKSLASQTHIISMIDGKPYQTLKRHLSKHDLTPEQYRDRYGLPKTYPMVAPAYSANRRAIAERLGLGKRVTGASDPKNPPAPATEASTSEPASAPAAKRTAVAKAAKPASAKVAKAATPKTSARAPTKPSAADKTSSPAKAKAAGKPATVEAPAAVARSKPAPKARKAAAAKPDTAPAPAPAPADTTKPAPRKRGPKGAVAIG